MTSKAQESIDRQNKEYQWLHIGDDFRKKFSLELGKKFSLERCTMASIVFYIRKRLSAVDFGNDLPVSEYSYWKFYHDCLGRYIEHMRSTSSTEPMGYMITVYPSDTAPSYATFEYPTLPDEAVVLCRYTRRLQSHGSSNRFQLYHIGLDGKVEASLTVPNW